MRNNKFGNTHLSVCIPTYDNAEVLTETIKKLLTLKNYEFEIVISDDNPNKNETYSKIQLLNDPRIKYFKNKKNLGYDGNLLITIHRAIGKYVFILMDDDEVDLENFNWILDFIKKNDEFSYLCGTLGKKTSEKISRSYLDNLKKKLKELYLMVRNNELTKQEAIQIFNKYKGLIPHEIFNECLLYFDLSIQHFEQKLKKFKGINEPYTFYHKDKEFPRGVRTLWGLAFRSAHGSGIVLKKKALDLKLALNYYGFLYIQQALIAQAIMKGKTFTTQKIFAYTGIDSNVIGFSEEDDERHEPLYKESHYWSPIGHLVIAKYRIQIVNDLIKNNPNKKKISKILFNSQKRYIIINFHEAMISSIRTFVSGISILFQMKEISKRGTFWLELIKEIIVHMIKSKIYTKYRPFRNQYVAIH